MSAADGVAGAQAYCAGAVRQGDRDRWLTTLFAPDAFRADLLALYAFNLEVARTAEVVSEPMLGQIRLQWWREAVAEIDAGTPRRHPVVEALADLHRRRPLPVDALVALIDAREADLEAEPFADTAAFLAYAEATSAPLVRLALAALGTDSDAAAVAAARGYAVAGLLRAVPFWARDRRLALPADRLAAAGLTSEDVFRRRERPRLAAVVRDLARPAEADLARLRPARAAVPALLPASLARLHLARLARAGHDPFTLAERPPPHLAAPLRLIWANWRGRP